MSSEDEFLLMPWGLPEGPAHHRRTPAAVHGAMIALELAKDSEEKRERERERCISFQSYQTDWAKNISFF